MYFPLCRHTQILDISAIFFRNRNNLLVIKSKYLIKILVYKDHYEREIVRVLKINIRNISFEGSQGLSLFIIHNVCPPFYWDLSLRVSFYVSRTYIFSFFHPVILTGASTGIIPLAGPVLVPRAFVSMSVPCPSTDAGSPLRKYKPSRSPLSLSWAISVTGLTASAESERTLFI